MTEQDKELLIKDLCARLPYEVIIHFNEGIGEDDQVLYGCRKNGKHIQFNDGYFVDEFKPYLRPLKSMTEEEMAEYATLQDRFLLSSQYPVTDGYEMFDWLNAHHFDFRGLIDKGLALEAQMECMTEQ